MKVWKVTYQRTDGQNRQIWVSAKSKTGTIRKDLRKINFKILDTRPVDIPTRQAELIEWLNVNCTEW